MILHSVRKALTGLALCVLAFPAVAQTTPEVASVLRDRIDHAVALVKPALVRIQVVTTDYSDGREQKYQATGSGVIISKDGYVVTNHHVAAHSTLITCTLASKEEIPASLVGTDALTDIAVLKLANPDSRE